MTVMIPTATMKATASNLTLENSTATRVVSLTLYMLTRMRITAVYKGWIEEEREREREREREKTDDCVLQFAFGVLIFCCYKHVLQCIMYSVHVHVWYKTY